MVVCWRIEQALDQNVIALDEVLFLLFFFFFQPKSTDSFFVSPCKQGGWSGVAKVSCILCHLGVQLILAYSSARLAILVAGRDRGQCSYFFYSLSFLFLFLP